MLHTTTTLKTALRFNGISTIDIHLKRNFYYDNLFIICPMLIKNVAKTAITQRCLYTISVLDIHSGLKRSEADYRMMTFSGINAAG